MISRPPTERAQRGQSITANFWNRSLDRIARHPAVPSQVMPNPIGGGDDEGEGTKQIAMRVANDRELIDREEHPAMYDDWFYATTHLEPLDEPDEEVTYIKVAKPFRLRRTPWAGRTFWLEALRVYVTYSDYGLAGTRRLATRHDAPNIAEWQMVWPEWPTNLAHVGYPFPDRSTTEGRILAVKLGEARTGIEGIAWEEVSPARDWTVRPASFLVDEP